MAGTDWGVFLVYSLQRTACALHPASRPELPRPYCPSPVPAAIGLTLRTVGPGAFHACGLTLAGKVYCWGNNDFGQTGDSTTTPRLTRVPIASDPRYADLSGRNSYARALTSEGVAYCWGALP
ncbi:MAG: hypothetical protein HY701_06390 [Gemmatimonadetes bacterium]|nr:hypothetical protein [Gemmatimonadota bacterium]